jgi:zinc transport system substrate-binding protein
MRKVITLVSTIVLLAVIGVPTVSADRLTVVASVFPLYDFAREVAGPSADVRILLPAGVDPHSWEPKPSDIVFLSRADIFLYTSETLEPWAHDLIGAVEGAGLQSVQVMDSLGFHNTDEQNSPRTVVDGGDDHGEDPHFWLNLSTTARTVTMIGELLSDHDPSNRSHYISNARGYSEKLLQLDERFRRGLESCRSKHVVTGGHAAFGHLTRKYGLEQVSVYGISPDAEPTPRQLARVVELVKDSGVKTIFSEETMNPKMAQVLSRETGAGIAVLNPAANLTAQQWQQGVTFLDIMERNLENLREGLTCE